MAKMEASEITELSRSLSKATAAKEPPAVLLGLLGKLNAGVVPTEELLRMTKVGVIVNKTKQHPNAEVARMASEMVNKWRAEVKKSTAKSSAAGTKLSARSSSSNGLQTPEPSAPRQTPEPRPSASASNQPRTFETDGVDTKRLGDGVRDGCVGLMYNGLAYGSNVGAVHILKRAIDIEAAAFKKYGNVVNQSYRGKMRSLYQNIKNRSNVQLRKRLLSGELDAVQLVDLGFQELKSDERRAEDQRLMEENMNKAMVAKEEKSVSTALTCGKCHQKQVSYTQAQTRSADEPMTTFCDCQVCGHKWKFS